MTHAVDAAIMASDQLESVWSYPRPPAVEPSDEHVRVVHRNMVIADTTRSMRLLETAHAPAYYIPAKDVRLDLLRQSDKRTVCEYKGVANYADLVLPDGGPVVRSAGWWYHHPAPGYEAIIDAICFYPQRVDLCEVDGEAVTPLQNSFYGDWPTSRIEGPYKGPPGTELW